MTVTDLRTESGRVVPHLFRTQQIAGSNLGPEFRDIL
jgi:hypothetical protein